MPRRRTNPRIDKAIFASTSHNYKTINLDPKSMRGGIRL